MSYIASIRHDPSRMPEDAMMRNITKAPANTGTEQLIKSLNANRKGRMDGYTTVLRHF